MLNAHDNRISGTIPSELAQMKSLRILDFGENRVSGIVPAQIGQMASLEFFSLWPDRVWGGKVVVPEMAEALRNLKNLQTLAGVFDCKSPLARFVPAGIRNIAVWCMMNNSSMIDVTDLLRQLAAFSALETIKVSTLCLSGPLQDLYIGWVNARKLASLNAYTL